jgi:DNA-binding PadR family transcriptional regulator
MSASPSPSKHEAHGYQLGVVQEVLLALIAGAPSNGYQLRRQLQMAVGPLAEGLNDGQVYVTLGRLEKAGLVGADQDEQTQRKVFRLTAAGQERLDTWLADTSWPKPAPAGFHLKLVAAAAAGLADPLRLIDKQRHAVLAELAGLQRTVMAEPDNSVPRLLLEGLIMRLQADLRWLEVCVRHWSEVNR